MRCIANKVVFQGVQYGNEITNQVKYFEGVTSVVKGTTTIDEEDVKIYTIIHTVNGNTVTSVLPCAEYKITVFGTEV